MVATGAYTLSARYEQKEAKSAAWALRLALFFLQLLLLTVLLHRFLHMSTPVAMNLFTVSLVGLGLAILLAVATLIRIWFGGELGTSRAFAAIFVALVALALPLWYLAHLFLLPPLTDLETTPESPIAFKVLAAQRPPGSNPIEDPDEAAAALQQKAYPDIRPLQLERSATEVFDMVNEAVKRLGWNVVLSEAPDEHNGVGRIEATARTLIMGFTDDVLVRVTGDDTRGVIDVRSVSRYGLHDLGANGKRIRTLFAEVKAELEKGESFETPADVTPKAKEPKVKNGRKRRGGRGNRPPTAGGPLQRPLSPD
jgi:uncharacterized protein (DUF1499 family)